MSNYKKHIKKTPAKETPRLDKVERWLIEVQNRLVRMTDPRRSLFGLGKQSFDPKAINYGGFNDRMFASSVDSLLAAILLYNIIRSFATLIFGQERAHQLYGGLIGRSTAEIIATFQSPGFLHDWLWNNVIYIGLTASIMIFLWVRTATSPGKWASRLRIVDATTGKAPTTKQSIIRYLGYFLSMIPFGLGFLWIIRDKKKQGWHDKLANTVVIRVQHWRLKNNPDSFFPTQETPPSTPQPEEILTKATEDAENDDKTLAL